MQKYLGVKLIMAIACFGRDNKPVPENSEFNGTEKEGYKVVYEDGYESWSPKEVFEKAYRKIKYIEDVTGYLIKEPHQERVLEEATELQLKVEKLENFISSNLTFTTLDVNEQNRLKQQLMAMQYYLTILVERIENF